MENHILKLEKKYWQGMQEHNLQTVKSLTRFPCITVAKSGIRAVDETAFEKMFASGANRKMKVLDISGVQTQILDDTAVIAYLIDLEFEMETGPSVYSCACSSTWVKDNGEYVCAMHTETELKK
ncbi:hypothetical protein GCM10027051_24770 [Niabella terrae]